MPISKKQNKSRKHFSRINKNKLRLTKLTGGSGVYSEPNLKTDQKQDIIQRLSEFMTIKKDLSRCDCKILLLFFLVNNLFENNHEIINQIFIDLQYSSSGKSVGNTNLINRTLKLIRLLLNDTDLKIEKELSCSKNTISEFLNLSIPKQSYKILFDIEDDEEYNKIISNILKIFTEKSELNIDLSYLQIMNPFKNNFKFTDSPYENLKPPEPIYEDMSNAITPATQAAKAALKTSRSTSSSV